MSPRKRSRQNAPGASSDSTTNLPATLPQIPSTSRSLASASGGSSASKQGTTPPTSTKPDHTDGRKPPTKQVRKSTSWYGSLGRKSSASTQLARETIMGGTVKSGSIPDFSRFDSRRNVDSSGDSDAQSIRTMPKIHETETQSTQTTQQNTDGGNPTTNNGKASVEDKSKDATQASQEATTDTGPDAPSKTLVSPEEAQRPSTSSGWFGWLGSAPAPEDQSLAGDKPATEPSKGTESAEPEVPEESQNDTVQAPPETPEAVRPASSWFGPWFSTPAPTDSAAKDSTEVPPNEAPAAKENEDVVMEDAPPMPAPVRNQPSAGSTWAFWSRDAGSNSTDSKTKSSSEQGELAVMGDGSEASPRRSSGVEVNDIAIPVKEPPLKKGTQDSPTKAISSKKDKRLRPQSMDLDEPTPARPVTPINKTAPPKPETPGSGKTLPPNLLLPSFKTTYSMKQNPSIIKQITQLLLRTRQPPANHVYLVKEPPKIKKAIAIGVHGLFPASFLRPMIGQPTGTSIRFANHCAEAIRRWADSHGCEDCEIEKVALEGEGKIADRVDNLWKLLLNWIEHIRSADLILLACHSQGVPVGLMLVAKLIDLGIITTARIGVCAMAGVSLGPFPDYKSGMGMLMGSAAELWQFADPQSEISQQLEHAMKKVLEHGGKVTYIGSIDDQLVPMESAIYSPASHPYIYRAVFVDGRIHAPDFIAHLVGFALKLRNLGISDQGLIRELSVALAGSLYSGEGHSRLYDEEQVYDLAVSHALETTVLNNVPCRIGKHEGLTSTNPYALPWIMRGVLEEDFVKTELSSETAELLKQFDDWKPTTKALKDIKFRLEVVRSKL
ncbi:hypothetical protein BJ170DRAFT_683626 [Xylariales sp. AK1849]|nr:hypothetical protein BJ170DRAFT_683626 [Xylariales sp. AK1849]